MEEEYTGDEGSEEIVSEVKEKPWYKKPGGVVLLGVGGLALLFILWLLYAMWSTPEKTAPPPEPYVDLTDVSGRDPEVLGLRIDDKKGRMFFDRGTDHTLYVKDGECTVACLDDWRPYTANEPVETDGPLGTILREDTGELQYTWNGQPLYTYVMDTTNTTFGDGVDGEWQIARP